MDKYSDSEVFRALNQEKSDKKYKSIKDTINFLEKNNIKYDKTHTPNVVSIRLKNDFIQLSLKKQGKKVKYCYNQKWNTIDLELLIKKLKNEYN